MMDILRGDLAPDFARGAFNLAAQFARTHFTSHKISFTPRYRMGLSRYLMDVYTGEAGCRDLELRSHITYVLTI